MKWIELLKAVAEYPAGKFLEVEDQVARSYIDAGLAKDGGDGPDVVILQRSIDTFRSELKGFVDQTAAAITEAAQGVAKRPIIRGVGLDIGQGIAAGESEADRRAGWGDIVRSVVVNADPQSDPEAKTEARDRLVKVYGFSAAGQGNWSAGDREVHPNVMRSFARSHPMIARNLAEGGGTTGGYLTAVTYETMLLQIAAEQEVFASTAQEVPMGARQTEWPALDQYSVPAAGQSAWFGGVRVYRKGEASQRTESDPAYKKIVLTAQDLTGYTEFSRDLLQDSVVTLDAQVPQLLGGAIGWRTDWECVNGNGLGQFLGIANSACLIQVTRNTASHIKYQDIFGMKSRLLPSELGYARWFVHPFALADIEGMTDGSGRLVYMPNLTTPEQGGPISAQTSGRLLGIPIVVTEKVSNLGTAGDLNLFSMRRYLKGTRMGLAIGISEHFKWDTDQIAVRAKVRNDGKPQLLNSIYLADGSGSNKVSAFVSLN